MQSCVAFLLVQRPVALTTGRANVSAETSDEGGAPRQTPGVGAPREDHQALRQRLAALLGRLLARHWLRSRDRPAGEQEAKLPRPPEN